MLYCNLIYDVFIYLSNSDSNNRWFSRQKSMSLVIEGKCIFTDMTKAEGSVGHFADDSSVMPSMTDVCV